MVSALMAFVAVRCHVAGDDAVIGLNTASENVIASPTTKPDVILWCNECLVSQRADTTTPATVTAKTNLLVLADAVMLLAPDPVTDKKILPPSGDVHDYWSVSSYDWPCNIGCNGSKHTCQLHLPPIFQKHYWSPSGWCGTHKPPFVCA